MKDKWGISLTLNFSNHLELLEWIDEERKAHGLGRGPFIRMLLYQFKDRLDDDADDLADLIRSSGRTH